MSGKGNISVTAQYTSWTWRWANLPCAELLASPEARGVFQATNAFLALTRPFHPRRPSLPHSLVQRHAMIDHCLVESGATQVLELAAGLSRRGAHFSADASLRYVEVDLPAMIVRKRELLARSQEGQQILARPNLEVVAGDVASLDLGSLLDPERDTLVIAEGLLMYLDAEEQRDLWGRLAGLLAGRPRSRLVFDLVPAVEQPPPGLLGRGLDALMRGFTQGQGFVRDERTRADSQAELHAAGFAAVESFEPSQVAAEWQLPFPEANTQQLLFLCGAAPSR
jgi:O-methyltransferase involved in polyketide biosynthesis